MAISKIGIDAWKAFHSIRINLLPPLVKNLSDNCGVSEAEYQIFMGLRVSPHQELTPSKLAETIGWDLARVSHQVSRMEAKGLINRLQCPEDARSYLLQMTKKGNTLIEKAFPLQMQEVNRLFIDALTTDQLKSLIEISKSIESHLEKLDLKRA